MTYAYRLQDLLVQLGSKAPAQAAALVLNRRHVHDGQISVGLKIHCLDEGRQFDRLVEGLGGASEILEINFYKHADASLCLVLPPVGSAISAIQLLECIETFIGSSIFGNPRIQLQLCSPGRLSAHASALLAIGFYLGSDTLRRYTPADLRTTFSSWFYVNGPGTRLVLYDAEGDFDRNFEWWNRHGIVERQLPVTNGRTDLLIGSGSPLDIRNVNLIATLLVHAEYDGYWHLLGEQFKYEMEALLQRHLLPGLLAAPWVCQSTAKSGDDDRFFAALQELVAYACGESARIRRASILHFRRMVESSGASAKRNIGGNANPAFKVRGIAATQFPVCYQNARRSCMISAHQPGSQPIDIPEAIPNPAVPERKTPASPTPKQPEKVPASL